jgi:hypothetical protein
MAWPPPPVVGWAPPGPFGTPPVPPPGIERYRLRVAAVFRGQEFPAGTIFTNWTSDLGLGKAIEPQNPDLKLFVLGADVPQDLCDRIDPK